MPRRLAEQPLWLRLLVAALILIACVLLLLVVGLLLEQDRPVAQQSVDLYAGIPVDQHLLALDKRALSEAYHAQALKLWGVLLADGARDTVPFTRGMTNLRRAYGLAAKQIEQREQKLEQQK
jgi:hypothetical protein